MVDRGKYYELRCFRCGETVTGSKKFVAACGIPMKPECIICDESIASDGRIHQREKDKGRTVSIGETLALLSKYGIKEPICGAGVGAGWLPLIEELIQKLIAAGWDRDCHQIKEKFGGLRFYVGEESEEVSKLVSQYEQRSFTVCEHCGDSGKTRGGGWILTLCDQCHESNRKRLKRS